MADEPEAYRPDPDDDEGGPVKSFLDHLEDLRWVLIKSLVAVGIAVLLCLLGGNYVVKVLKWPLDRAKISYAGTNQVVTIYFLTNQIRTLTLDAQTQANLNLGTNRFVAVRVEPKQIGTNNVLCWNVDSNPELAEQAQHLKIELTNFGPAESFFVAFQVALYAGLGLASFAIFWYVGGFIFPALKMKEKKHIVPALVVGAALFATGVCFCYFALMPMALAASQRYSEWLGFNVTQWKAGEYFSFVCKFMLGMGLGFEMPVVIMTLVRIGILNYRILAAGRKYMIVVNLVLGGILTTPEVITQVLMFIPLQLLYEISIWMAWWYERKQKKLEAQAELHES